MKSTAGRFSKIALAICAGLLVGCTAQSQYPECKNDLGCGEHGEVCVTGFCRQCRDDGQCKPGEQCVNGGCFARPECSADLSCAPGLLCRAGKCTPECSEATGATDCGFGRKCMEGRCVAAEECEGDGECGMGKACVEGKCRGQGGIVDGSTNSPPLSCRAGPIYFGYDEPSLNARGREALNEAWQCVQREGYRRLRLSGHTDERGTTEYNLALGSRRAQAVRRYLIDLGAEARKVRAVSFGKERPAVFGHDEASWEKNRRVEIDLEK